MEEHNLRDTITSHELYSDSLVLVVSRDNLSKGPLANMAGKLQLVTVNLPLVTRYQNLVGIIHLACKTE